MVQFLPMDLEPGVIAGVTMVDTSVLPWPGTSFGITPHADAGHVEQSYELLAQTLKWERNQIVTAQQVHGCDIVDVQQRGSYVADALVTTSRNVIIGVKIADCCGVLITNAECTVIAAVHSGWRGTSQNITGAVVEYLRGTYDVAPSSLRAALSPCASGTVYEVGADVQSLMPTYCKPLAEGKWLFDNHQAIADQLRAAGVDDAFIHVHPGCTMTDPAWHSYRRDKERSGRMLAFIAFP